MVRVKTAAQMQRLVAQWRASGEPQARFARRHGVRPWTLWYWSWKGTPAAAAPPVFVPVQVPPPPEPLRLEIVLPDGVRVVAWRTPRRRRWRRWSRPCGRRADDLAGGPDLRGDGRDRSAALYRRALGPGARALRARPVGGPPIPVSQPSRRPIKILAWDRSGSWVLYKRLEQRTFAWPTTSDGPVEIASADLALLLAGVDLAHTRRRRWYERVA